MRRLNDLQWKRRQRVEELLASGVGQLDEAERRELRELYVGADDWSGAFFTPPVVAQFVVDMALATLGEPPRQAMDPWCGIAPFFEYLPAGTQVTGIEILQQEAAIDQALYPLARVIRANTWDIWTEYSGQDLVLANPPFGVAGSCPAGLGLGQRRPRVECLALEAAVRLVRPGGVVAVILPDSVLANTSCRYIRDWLLEQCYLRASISLPTTTFYWQATRPKTSVLVVERKAVPAPRDVDTSGDYWVYMAVCDDVGWDSRGRPTGNSELPIILDVYRRRFDPDRGELAGQALVYEQMSLFDW